ncbi:MAG: sulfonate ABC transporter substrate-binding protein, partial [Burkholderiaceae bacterium]|nr:sulfonate ABC transporter substrate-binding protein [Burkholderiaceae bacterium]
MNPKISSLSRRRLIQGAASALALPVLGQPATAAAAPSRELRIGHQKGLLSLLKGRGTLEKRLAPLGVSVKWIEFT